MHRVKDWTALWKWRSQLVIEEKEKKGVCENVFPLPLGHKSCCFSFSQSTKDPVATLKLELLCVSAVSSKGVNNP